MVIDGLIGLLDDITALAKLSAASLDDVSAAAGRATAKAAEIFALADGDRFCKRGCVFRHVTSFSVTVR
ncbi:uncharacterized protein DUF808 [Vreelandella songnenensis]|uniref:Uncharacterized protein DUF808 n=1 Tax=Vreelandella songnenensis TaxID=1176243 RepID=A0A2T0V4U1_9GAMM|nr:DUF808 family protein [Halomonas songnenensis]PRY65192.1 uncharacterized protein DUF808 [Halomonas songnenensis]